MKHDIYLSASTQQDNRGVLNYGTEEEEMFKLRDEVEKLILKGNHAKDFIIYKNSNKSSSLSDIVNASNRANVDTHWAFHTNAGDLKARGCEVYYHDHSTGGGKKMADIWYKKISALTPTSDRGSKSDYTLYSKGLYELRETKAHAALSEFIFHTNQDDVKFFLANTHKFALATCEAIHEYYGLIYKQKEDVKVDYTGIMLEAYNKGWFTKTGYKENDIVTFEKLCYILKNYENYLDKKYNSQK